MSDKKEAPEEKPSEDLQARADACDAEIRAVLRKHRCQIWPRLEVEPIGQTMAKAVCSARYDVLAIPDEQ